MEVVYCIKATASYRDILQQYIRPIQSKYGEFTIVFDDYLSGTSSTRKNLSFYVSTSQVLITVLHKVMTIQIH